MRAKDDGRALRGSALLYTQAGEGNVVIPEHGQKEVNTRQSAVSFIKAGQPAGKILAPSAPN